MPVLILVVVIWMGRILLVIDLILLGHGMVENITKTKIKTKVFGGMEKNGSWVGGKLKIPIQTIIVMYTLPAREIFLHLILLIYGKV